ncbi:hypothetical protein OHA21_13295 [Actinoplanes sp. NBC_00393]|uniref:hypothetical protein n=1 Tax=Actinoplanes sp. NBC_00393 TaxID=2975953 RepID=UPI002E1ED66F
MNTKSRPGVVGTFLALLGVICLLVAQFTDAPGGDWQFWGLVMLFGGLLLRIEGAIRDRESPQ